MPKKEKYYSIKIHIETLDNKFCNKCESVENDCNGKADIKVKKIELQPTKSNSSQV